MRDGERRSAQAAAAATTGQIPRLSAGTRTANNASTASVFLPPGDAVEGGHGRRRQHSSACDDSSRASSPRRRAGPGRTPARQRGRPSASRYSKVPPAHETPAIYPLGQQQAAQDQPGQPGRGCRQPPRQHDQRQPPHQRRPCRRPQHHQQRKHRRRERRRRRAVPRFQASDAIRQSHGRQPAHERGIHGLRPQQTGAAARDRDRRDRRLAAAGEAAVPERVPESGSNDHHDG